MSTIKLNRASFIGLLAWISLTYLPGVAIAQAGSDTTATLGKAQTSMELIYTEANNSSKLLSATVKTKVNDVYQGVNGITVNYYLKEVSPAQLLGSATSNNKGVAVLVVPKGKISPPTGSMTFIAAVENNDKFEDNKEELTVAESDFNMNLSEEDSVRQISITLTAPNDKGVSAPVPETEVHLYVQRLFGLLPLSEDTEKTDENGEIKMDFPAGIPGDTSGNLIIVAKVEENETYGNLEFRRKINWGKPLVIDKNKHIRELWSSRANAPYYLIFIVNAMLIGIWGVIFYIVYTVYQIYRLGRLKTP